MTFPTTAIDTTYLSAGSADPSQARGALYSAVTYLNTIVAEANAGNGVLVLQANGTIDATVLPSTIAPSGANLTLNPSTGIVKIQSILRLQNQPKATILATTAPVAGDLALASDVASGPALCMYTGSAWKYLPLASLTTLT
jgi:hypothetical protein